MPIRGVGSNELCDETSNPAPMPNTDSSTAPLNTNGEPMTETQAQRFLGNAVAAYAKARGLEGAALGVA
jgi:hypothetical protein